MRKYKQEKKRVTYTDEERRENSKVKEYKKKGGTKRLKGRTLNRYVNEGSKSLKYTLIYLN